MLERRNSPKKQSPENKIPSVDLTEQMGAAAPDNRPFADSVAHSRGRWERQAKKDAERGIVAKTREKAIEGLTGKQRPEKNWVDFMHEEWDRDQADYRNKLHAEYGEWEKYSQPVRDFYLQRAGDPERKLEQKETVLVEIWTYGGMRAAEIAGRALARNEMKIDSNVVDISIGISSGDVVAKCAVAGHEQILRSMAMMRGAMAGEEFIDESNYGNSINLSYLERLQRGREAGGEYTFDIEAFKKAHCESWTVVTHPIVGNQPARVELLDNKADGEDPITNTVSSMSIPGMTGKIPRRADGSVRYDGGFAEVPIKEIVEKIRREHPGADIKISIQTQASFEALDDMKPDKNSMILSKALRGLSWATVALDTVTSLLPGAAGSPKFQGLGSLDIANVFNQLSQGLVGKRNQRMMFEKLWNEIGEETGNKVEFDINFVAEGTTLELMSTDADEMDRAFEAGYRNEFKKFGLKAPEVMPRYVPQKEQLAKAIQNFEDSRP